MKYTDVDKSDLLVEVSVFVGRKHILGISDSAEIVDSAKIVAEIVAESDEKIVAEIVDSAEIVVDIDEEIVAELVNSAESEWIFAATDL